MSHIRLCAIVLCGLATGTIAHANDDNRSTPNLVIETSSAEDHVKNIKAIAFSPRLNLKPDETHSGLSLPRWVSLKYGDVNGRKGPGKDYQHLWTFQRKGMPVIVVNEMDHWRKIRDIEGGESWVRSVALSGNKTAIVTTKTPLRKKAKTDSRILAQIQPNVLLKIDQCDQTRCFVEIDTEVQKGKKKGPKGYVLRADIWGDETF